MASQTELKSKPVCSFLLGWIIAVVAVFVASAGFVFAHQTRIAHQTDQLQAVMAQGPRVLVVPISSGSPARVLQLPASIHGYIEAPVYAKVAGYMKSIPVDKGDHVHRGEIIAVVESPETDKQVADALANYHLQLITDHGDEYLPKNEVIAQQEADTQHAMMLQARATMSSSLRCNSMKSSGHPSTVSSALVMWIREP